MVCHSYCTTICTGWMFLSGCSIQAGGDGPPLSGTASPVVPSRLLRAGLHGSGSSLASICDPPVAVNSSAASVNFGWRGGAPNFFRRRRRGRVPAGCGIRRLRGLTSIITQADRPICKDICIVLRSPENIRYFSKNRYNYSSKMITVLLR